MNLRYDVQTVAMLLPCLSSRQETMLQELSEVAKRIEKLSKAEHDLIREVHPKVEEIKESVEDVSDKVASQKP